MARKIKFALEMADGAKVRGDIDELREHFDLESVVRYFLSGKLVEWLDDRYYEDEAEALEGIDKDAPDFHQKLCEILGVEYKAEDDLDVAALERLNEKKAILRQRTDDEEIIKNADKTALTQEDLADLLDMGETKIYLCGEKFTIPMRVKGITYIGVLGTPFIDAKIKNRDELKEKRIVLENVMLHDDEQKSTDMKTNNSTQSEGETYYSGSKKEDKDISSNKVSQNMYKLEEVLWAVFPKYKNEHSPIWEIVTSSGRRKEIDLNSVNKEIAMNIVCHGKYVEKEVLFIRVASDFKAGWAFTKDSFCYGGSIGNGVILYVDISSVRTYLGSTDGNGLWLTHEEGKGDHFVDVMMGKKEYRVWCKDNGCGNGNEVLYGNCNIKKMDQIAKFLSVVKNLYGEKTVG